MVLKKRAFTLAETLVVMGIIGVIAALTIPNLSQSTGDRERVAKVKKSYSQLNEVFDRAQAVYGPFDDWFTSDMDESAQATRFGERMTEFMKISKNCKTGTGCFSSSDPTGMDSDTNRYKVIAADGVSFSFQLSGSSGTVTTDTAPLKGDYKYPIQVIVDIDGLKSKSIFGKNKFTFDFFRNAGCSSLGNSYSSNYFVDSMKYNGQRWAAAKWVLEFDNMDYLKIDSNWKCTTGSGKVLNLTANPPVTSCR